MRNYYLKKSKDLDVRIVNYLLHAMRTIWATRTAKHGHLVVGGSRLFAGLRRSDSNSHSQSLNRIPEATANRSELLNQSALLR